LLRIHPSRKPDETKGKDKMKRLTAFDETKIFHDFNRCLFEICTSAAVGSKQRDDPSVKFRQTPAIRCAKSLDAIK
jgi:hypothetical protein